MNNDIEKRFLAAGQNAPVVSRCCGKGKAQPAKIVGYAATFGTRSQNLGGFTETIQKGAFKNVLSRAASGAPEHDVVALWNHDPNLLLGRLSSGTLKLYEDERGLRYEIIPPEWARGYVESVERGDVTGSSFSFSVSKRSEQWTPGEKGADPLRSISEVDRLVDVGPVVFPAYLSTESKVSARCVEMANTVKSKRPAAEARAVAALEWVRNRRNCGDGAGGFKIGNTCAKGGDGGDGGSKKNFEERHPRDQEKIDQIKQGKLHSYELHAVDGQTTDERHTLHKQIIDSIIPHNIKTVTGRQPIFYMMGGGPASGKSTMLNSGQLRLPPNAVHIDADAIKEQIPEYVALKNAGDKDAARFVHEESSELSKKATKIAISRNADIVLDSTGDGQYESLQRKLRQAREAGYKIVGYYATNKVSLARKLSHQRYLDKGRYVPDEHVIDIHKSVSRVLPKAIRDGLYDEVRLYDTNVKDKARKVLTYTGDSDPVIHDQKLYRDFLDKARGIEHE